MMKCDKCGSEKNPREINAWDHKILCEDCFRKRNKNRMIRIIFAVVIVFFVFLIIGIAI